MAVNIFEKYGIKQVANVYFEALENDVKAGVLKGDIVLFLDTLKVSTIETTAENVAAQGGWGNPRLISWDYGKEINVTLTDALMSLESLRFMMGGAIKEAKSSDSVWVKRTAEVVAKANGVLPQPQDRFGGPYTPVASAQHPIKVINLTKGTRSQITSNGSINGTTVLTMKNTLIPGLGDYSTAKAVEEGDHIRIFWEEERKGDHDAGAIEVTISPDVFPGTYRVVGDTFMRNQNGKDEPFQFIIDRAKVQSSVTLTLEAEGDPTTFEMTLQVLRGETSDEMMKLVRYGTDDTSVSGNGDDTGSLTGNG